MKRFIANRVLESALSQLDKLGYELAKLGVTDQVNRHTAIGLAMSQKLKVEGQLESAKIRYTLAKSEVNALTNKIDEKLDQALDVLPSTISTRAKRARDKLRCPKGCQKC